MAKKKNKNKGLVASDSNEAPVMEITSATLKDEKCSYSYRIVAGKGKGFSHNVSGPGIVFEDMIEAFKALNVHLAIMDDAFDTAGVPVDNLSDADNTPLSENYTVRAFEVKGKDESQAIVLKGDKYLKRSSKRMELKTPNIDLWNSMYEHNEALSEAIENCKREVMEYMNGKYTMPVEEVVDISENQTSILDETANAGEKSDAEATFESSEV